MLFQVRATGEGGIYNVYYVTVASDRYGDDIKFLVSPIEGGSGFDLRGAGEFSALEEKELSPVYQALMGQE